MIIIITQIVLDKCYSILSIRDKFIWSILLSITLYCIISGLSWITYGLYILGFIDLAYSIFYYQTQLYSSQSISIPFLSDDKKLHWGSP